MKRSVLFTSMLLAGAMTGTAQAASMEVALLQEAIISGKTNLDLRLRGEWVDDTVHREAFAETLRAVLGYKTGDYHGLKAFLEFENVSDFGRNDFSATAPAATNPNLYALVPDPDIAQVNQSYLEGYGFKAGRQKIIFDNARFIGDVGWRQNDQTFDAVSYSNSTLAPDLTINLDYAFRVLPPTGIRRPIDAPMVNIRYAHFPVAKVSVFYYGFEEVNAKTTSWQDIGTRVDGTIGNFLYEASFAQQDDYADGTAANSPEANYTDFQVGYKFGPVTVKAEQETLEKGFKTPLATQHAFNGWADRFSPNKPTNGLVDTNLKLLAKLGDWNFVLAGYTFEAETGGVDFGNEVDFSVAYQYTKNISMLAKYAKYDAKDKVTLVGTTGNKDLEKGWLQFQFKF